MTRGKKKINRRIPGNFGIMCELGNLGSESKAEEGSGARLAHGDPPALLEAQRQRNPNYLVLFFFFKVLFHLFIYSPLIFF